MTKKSTLPASALAWDKANTAGPRTIDVMVKAFGEDDFSKRWAADLIAREAVHIGLKVKRVDEAGHVLEITGTLK